MSTTTKSKGAVFPEVQARRDSQLKPIVVGIAMALGLVAWPLLAIPLAAIGVALVAMLLLAWQAYSTRERWIFWVWMASLISLMLILFFATFWHVVVTRVEPTINDEGPFPIPRPTVGND